MAANRHCQGGFTLSEVLISLGLVSLIAVALLAAAQVQVRLHREQDRLQATQDNARAALEVLAHDARLLGAASRGWGMINSTGSGPPTVPIVHVWDSFGGAGPDRLDLIVPSGEMLTTPTPTPSQPGTLQVDLARLDPASQADPATAAPATSALAAGDYLLLSNITAVAAPRPPQQIDANSACSGPGTIGAMLLQVSGIAGPNAVNVSQLSPQNCIFPRGSLVSRALVTSYSIDGNQQLVIEDGGPLRQSPFPPGPSVPLAEAIVDLQIAVGVDGLNGHAADGVLDEVGTAPNDDEWIYNVDGELYFPVQPPSALRITIVARTLSPDPGAPSAGRPAVENHAGGPPDGYRYRVLTTTMVPRNLVQP